MSITIMLKTCCLIAAATLAAASNKLQAIRLIGYFDANSQDELPVESIPYRNLTHIVLTNALKVDSSGKLHYRQQMKPTEHSAENLIKHLASLPVKLIIGLRGHSDDVDFDELAEVDNLRERFATDMAVLLRNWNADGLEIEWHSDDPNGGKPLTAPFDTMEQFHFALLCRDLVGALRAAGGKTLSVAVRPGRQEFANGLFVHEYIDWLTLCAYSMRSLGDPHHSSLKDMVTALDEWRLKGVRTSQLVLGTSLFARPGAALNTAGDRNEALRRSWKQVLRGDMRAPSGGDLRGDLFLDHETGKSWWVSGVNTTQAKVAYVRKHGYGGIALRDLHQDTNINGLSLVTIAIQAAQEAEKGRLSSIAGQLSLFQHKFRLSRAEGDDTMQGKRDEF